MTQILSRADARQWCEQHGLRFRDGGASDDRIAPADTAEAMFRVPIPEDATATVALSYVLLMTGVHDYEEHNFDGAMIWLRRWEIWSESIDRAGYALLEGVRSALGITQTLHAAPAVVFSGEEFVRTQACLSLPMLFQWDAYFVPVSGGFVVDVSHEGCVKVHSSKEAQPALLQRFHDWNPKEA